MSGKNYALVVVMKITCALNASMKDAAEFVKRQVTIRGQRNTLIIRLTRRKSVHVYPYMCKIYVHKHNTYLITDELFQGYCSAYSVYFNKLCIAIIS